MLIYLAMMAAQVEVAPDRTTGIAMVETALKAMLKDPDSAQFTWGPGFVNGSYHPVFAKKKDGWLICGTVNARNSFGGYTGQYAAVGVIAGGTVVKVDMDEPGRWSAHAGWVADQCRKNGQPVI